MSEFRFSLIFSLLFHGGFIYVSVAGLPYFSRDLPTIDRPIPVEIVNIDDVTRVKEPEPQPVQEEVQATPEPVRARPHPRTETPVPNPDLAPKTKPDQTEVERKQIVASVTPQTKPRPPTSFDAGEISALIDRSRKDKPTQENTREEELEAAVNSTLSQGLEARRNTATIEDFVRSKMQGCWRHPGGALNAGELVVVISFALNIDGFLVGTPKIQNQTQILASNNPFYEAAAENALRAVRLCEPYELPRELYDQWKDMRLNFDPSDMAG